MGIWKRIAFRLITLSILTLAWNPGSAAQPTIVPGSLPAIAPARDANLADEAAIRALTRADLFVTSTGFSATSRAVITGTLDLAVQDFSLVQTVAGEPLVIDKLTDARVTVALPADTNVDAQVKVEVNGKTVERTVNLVGPETTVTLRVDAPREVKPITAQASVIPAGQVIDPNLADNSKMVTYQTVQTMENVVAFFLPVDWTSEERSKHTYNTTFKQYVQDAGDFMIATYPLPGDHLVVDFTMTPHMLAPSEKILVDSQGKFSMRNALALYASLSFAGRRYRPDATMVIGVLPPGWFDKHGQRGTLGLTLNDVKGIVTAQYEIGLPAIVAAHEIGHLYYLGEDYDYAVKPSRPCFQIRVPGYWVQRDQELSDTSQKKLCTFMSSGDPRVAYWVDQRIYEYLLAKFALNGGTASAPLILAATTTWGVEDAGYPNKSSGNAYRFEPNQPVYCSVAGIALKAGSTLEAKLYRDNALVRTTDRQTTVAGNRWYPFLMAEPSSLEEGLYRVDVYLDRQPVKSSQFEVKASH